MEKVYEINKLQKTLWFEWKINPSSNAYNNIYIYKTGAKVSMDNLNKGLSIIHQLFPSLSSQFRESPLGIKQHLMPHTEIKATVLQSKTSLLALLLSPFNLNSEPLFRYAMFVQHDEIYLGFCWHHIITDAHSINILLKIVSEFLTGKEDDQIALNYHQIQQSEIVITQDYRFQQKLISAQAYWQVMLKGVTPCLLRPMTNPPIQKQSMHGKRLVFSVSNKLANIVMHRVGQLKTTLFIYIASCISKVLFNIIDDNKIILGFAVNCRERNYLNQIGNFAVPLLLILERSSNTEYLVESISKQVSAGRNMNQFMLSDIFRLYRNQTQLPLKKLFNVSINYGTDFWTPLLLQAIPVIYEGFDCTNDLVIRYEYVVNSIVFEIDYDSAKFSKNDIQQYSNEILTQLSCA